jgi:hypothetical protein
VNVEFHVNYNLLVNSESNDLNSLAASIAADLSNILAVNNNRIIITDIQPNPKHIYTTVDVSLLILSSSVSSDPSVSSIKSNLISFLTDPGTDQQQQQQGIFLYYHSYLPDQYSIISTPSYSPSCTRHFCGETPAVALLSYPASDTVSTINSSQQYYVWYGLGAYAFVLIILPLIIAILNRCRCFEWNLNASSKKQRKVAHVDVDR